MSANPYQPPMTKPETSKRVEAAEFAHPRRWVLAIPWVGLSLGAISRWSRPFLFREVHWDAVISIVVMLLISLVYLRRCYRGRLVIALGYYQSGLISLWTMFAVGWCAVHGSIFNSLVETCAALWFVLAVGGLVLLMIRHWITGSRQNNRA